MANFSSFFSIGQDLKTCFRCWILCRFDWRCLLASDEAEDDSSAGVGEEDIQTFISLHKKIETFGKTDRNLITNVLFWQNKKDANKAGRPPASRIAALEEYIHRPIIQNFISLRSIEQNFLNLIL